ncbi:MAG TPA: SgcJ/EcaC family oxidoreductase [Vicinamibacterales bacterium]|nr:SgcJ/EcaC family oxidoreductase [Vicinamibacterales bacterium]
MQTDEQAIREVVSTWLRASKAGDTKTVLSLMTDDVVFLVPGHPPMRGKAAFASSQAAMEQFDFNATSEVQEVTVLGDWAYIWTQLSVVMTPKGGGEAVRRSGPTLSIFRKESGRWLLARDANMLNKVA